ncbi:hypothetical protein P280DRAFT_508048 [Massarina eburnea CBS 473.64]|uniref:cutinase n=1 Tax=Massarina eburnea CBS 473.64 TaxID=1395130 RepID=A0A6A6RWV6_9PLEO|nr:hypothetical protein P280DRAFT_508048 [Massarina eburnea CBS 473.64]
MKSTVISSLLFASLAIASPTPRATADSDDVSDGMVEVINGKAKCKNNAVIFARGTFDSGNIGVWVGPYLKSASLDEFNGDVQFQGVSEKDYPANLVDYVKEDGSEACGTSCAKTIDAYVKKCPTANIFVSGWSQGGLCAHKCIKALAKATSYKNIKGIVTFGDEAGLMSSVPAFPKDIPVKAFCNEDTAAPDILCTETATSGIKLPTSISEFKDLVVDALAELVRVATNSEQRSQATKLPFTLAYNFLKVTDYFTTDLKKSNLRRWMVLPPHFVYGNNGMSSEAAEFFLAQSKTATSSTKASS